MLNDLLKNQKTAYVKLDAQMYQAEQELADRYRSFVAEILRLSLGGVAVFSYIYKLGSDVPRTNYAARDILAIIGVALFSVSLLSALAFLYAASEGLRWYIAGLRALSSKGEDTPGKQDPDTYLAKRDTWIVHCSWSKLLAAGMLALGGIFMALALLF